MEEYLRVIRDRVRCDSSRSDFQTTWEAKGKLFFLPNHQYEIETRVQLSIAHPSVEATQSEVKEYLYFETKGLPGLNAQERIGEEIESYVRSVYCGGRSRVYREEPIAVAFQEDFYVAVPLSLRPPGTIEERHQLFRMALTTRPDTATKPNTKYTATDDDWIVTHRTLVCGAIARAWEYAVTASQDLVANAISVNPLRARLAQITQRLDTSCPLADPTQVISPLLIARPQGEPDPENLGAELWLAGTSYRATVRQEGAPFVDRRTFVSADLTALTLLRDSGNTNSTWDVLDGELRLTAGGQLCYARFGEEDWNHLRIQLSVCPDTGTAGLALSLPGGSGPPNRGLYAVVRPATGGGREIALLSRRSGTELVSLATAPLAGDEEWVVLTVSAFDDRLQVKSGDTTVEADRSDLREGRLALVGSGGVRFRSLRVEGLDMYTFTFATSRYRSFARHIQSYNGRLGVIPPDVLGPGSTVESVASLWSTTGAEVLNAMQADGSLEARQGLFLRWVEGLAVPLVQEVEHLLISRIGSGADITGFLLESPEPLDFVEEVTVGLRQLVRVQRGNIARIRDALRHLIWDLWGEALELSRLGTGPDIPARARRSDTRLPVSHSVADLLDREALGRILLRASDRTLTDGLRPLLGARTRENITLSFSEGTMAVTHEGPDVWVFLDEHAAGRGGSGLRVGDRVEVVEVLSVGDDGRIHIRRWAGWAERRGGNMLGVRAKAEGTQITSVTTPRLGLDMAASDALDGIMVAVDPNRGRIIDWFVPRWEWQAVDLHVLQDETAMRAFLVPVDEAGDARTLSTASRYKLDFAIDRQRWSTTDAPDADNRYQDSTTLDLSPDQG
jgi:hypothetical protein